MTKGKKLQENCIKLNEDTYLIYDKYQYWMAKLRKSAKGGGEYLDRVTGFYARISDCMDDYFEHRAGEVMPETLTKLYKLQVETRRDIKTWCKTLEDAYKEIRSKV